LLVIAGHWLPETNWLNRITGGNTGYIGVTVFFVLSGFLITCILLNERTTAEASGIPKGAVVKNFFIRRALRIFPVYYLTIFGLLFFQRYTGTHIQRDFIYYLTYTANISIFKNQQWDGMVAHLWSLSVEEQFYLLWPWLMLFCRKAFLQTIVLLFIGIGIASSYFFSSFEIDTLTTSCFDAFGLGALLALQFVYRPDAVGLFYKRARMAGFIGLALFCFSNITSISVYLPLRTQIACIALWAITYIVSQRHTHNNIQRLLCNNYLVGLGRISYGIYLFHLPLFYVTSDVLGRLFVRFLTLPHPLYMPLLLTGSFVLLILLSLLSWQGIEKPFLKLKRYFKLNKKAVVPKNSQPIRPLSM
ncbi:MAG TPA: acyltransferase, partial [Chitinophagaceae bacterium]|nr:acyltransferase [Chitinophagaceae bacterium]